MKSVVPSEDWEQSQFVVWLDLHEYTYTSIPNSTYTKSWAQKAKNTRNGLRPGLPDMLVCLKVGGCLWIEMKKTKGGRVSPDQKLWIENLNRCGMPAFVCCGCDEAIKKVLEYESNSVRGR